ncbi:ABC transporter ATP-binding protein [Robbsia sp. Bb-Pol-6]|uniref:ABC transporter ATP-binding protein n=1 Tax=Robbsia betulipollinis TaxID=2981849 RepID=A0ABT3ZHA2_9BURK|nr:ABC transporter ATP-binding protein [Robbsia betulipollinis]MCY0385710.1 ABC transporter ATP-binding protein [Robbsia betulipollinis]
MSEPVLRVAHLSLARIGPRERVGTRAWGGVRESVRRAVLGAVRGGMGEQAAQALVDDLSFDIAPGECLGLIGASGSGKTLTGLAIAGVLPDGVHRRRGTVDIAPGTAHGAADRRAPGAAGTHPAAMIFQDPRAALSPVRRVGAQLDDVLRAAGMPRGERRAAALALLVEVGLDAPADCLDRYTFELSGGMCQRVLIALALARRPRLLIADEPTTGLDTRTQARVLDLLRHVATTRAMSTLLITHDLAVACHACTRIAVLHAGRIVEIQAAGRFLADAVHPCSRALIAAMPRTACDVAALGTGAPTVAPVVPVVPVVPVAPVVPVVPVVPNAFTAAPASTPTAIPVLARVPQTVCSPAAPVLSVRGVTTGAGRGKPILEDIGFDIAPGEALGIVGRSGCGKSTLAHVLARVTAIDAGSIVFEGIDIAAVSPRRAAGARWRGALQLVFQDVRASLDPLSRVRDAIAAPWRGARAGSGADDALGRGSRPPSLDDAIATLAAKVALPLMLLDRRPHQLSGGEATRVGLARALASRPRLLILDEPTASLDMTTQASIVRTIDALRRAHGMALVFISHDLELVRLLCDRVLVMDAGRIVEAGDCATVFRAPAHPVTQGLLDARLRVGDEGPG